MNLACLARVVVVVGAMACVGCTHASGAEVRPAPAAQRRAVLVNLTSGKNDLHAASMGLSLARNALDRGAAVVVFLNVAAAQFADRDLGDGVRYEDFPPIANLLREVIDRGGRVYACGHCLALMKVRRDNVAPGIVVTGHGEIVEALQPGMVGFTY